MLAQPDPQTKSAFKNPFLYSWAALGIAALVVGWMRLDTFLPLAGKPRV